MVYYCEECKKYYSEEQIKVNCVRLTTLTDPAEYEDITPCGCLHEDCIELDMEEVISKLNNM